MSTSTRAPHYLTCDANEAVASVAYRLNELIAIYPITPSSTMAELCDEWAAAGKPNLWGEVPRVVARFGGQLSGEPDCYAVAALAAKAEENHVIPALIA